MRQDSDAYYTVKNVAFVMLALFPVGIPLGYFCILLASRRELFDGVSSSLSRATTFLSADYETFAFWWEPLEMCRKLALTGWVLLIPEE